MELDSLTKLLTSSGSRRTSLFDLDFACSDPDGDDKSMQSDEATEKYLKILEKEKNEWKEIISEMQKPRKTSLKLEITEDILESNQIRYLKKIPDIEKFINETAKFRNKANYYLEEYDEAVKMRKHLIEIYTEKLNDITIGLKTSHYNINIHSK